MEKHYYYYQTSDDEIEGHSKPDVELDGLSGHFVEKQKL